jgi:hypothetical protein
VNSSGDGARVKAMMTASVLNDNDFYFMLADGQATAAQYGNKAALCRAVEQSPSDPESLMQNYGAYLSSILS